MIELHDFDFSGGQIVKIFDNQYPELPGSGPILTKLLSR